MPRSACSLALLLAAGLVGCQPSQQATNTGLVGSKDVTWPYWPTAMRIHPLTRLVTSDDAGGPLIEARVEFTDRDGVTSRAFGQMQLELLASSSRTAEPLVWKVDMESTTTNATHFDDITRTYLFKLGLDPEDRVGTRLLRVTFFGAEGREFGDRMEIETGG